MTAATQSFQDRVGSVFGAVDSLAAEQPGQQPWQLQQSLVFREGADAGSSDEEEDRAATDRQQALTDSELLDMGNGNADLLAASGAFCTALDREAEFDEADALAVQSSGTGAQHMPPRMMQVPDGNVYQISMARRLPGRIQEQAELCTASAPGAQRRSYVPDFVRRPGAYTCYELEEPLVVGSGDNASAGAAQAMADSTEQNLDGPGQAATAAPVQDSAPGQLGHDVAFRPRTGRGHQSRPLPANAEEPQHRGPTALVEDEEDAAQEAEARQLHPAKRRQLRNKAGTS